MTSTNVYQLAISTWHRVVPFVVMVFLSIFGIGVIVVALWMREFGPHLLLFAFWCAALAWNWYVLLNIPYEIRFDTPDRISFVALARSTTVSAADILSIKPWAGLYTLRHTGGKVRLIPQFTGFHEVITRIKTLNPAAEIVGI